MWLLFYFHDLRIFSLLGNFSYIAFVNLASAIYEVYFHWGCFVWADIMICDLFSTKSGWSINCAAPRPWCGHTNLITLNEEAIKSLLLELRDKIKLMGAISGNHFPNIFCFFHIECRFMHSTSRLFAGGGEYANQIGVFRLKFEISRTFPPKNT